VTKPWADACVGGIESGELEAQELRDGTFAVEVPAEPRRWRLIPSRLQPDPGLLCEFLDGSCTLRG
jgi:hypothetical protein